MPSLLEHAGLQRRRLRITRRAPQPPPGHWATAGRCRPADGAGGPRAHGAGTGGARVCWLRSAGGPRPRPPCPPGASCKPEFARAAAGDALGLECVRHASVAFRPIEAQHNFRPCCRRPTGCRACAGLGSGSGDVWWSSSRSQSCNMAVMLPCPQRECCSRDGRQMGAELEPK
jgi:hypothetical protein